ncbi:uncharacterized protein LOC142178299 [Nicotiana tabacum]|uniref:Uncharacterized protein LOC142178299 n=1 Tax=Nicotiana tabacum TaxID=4097 RepID=A0AC58U2L4_TOBAC
MYFKTAKEVWKDINERFGQSNGSKYLQIQREISTTIQGFSDIANYFTKLRTLWDELNSSYVGATCSCGALPKFIEDQQLFQFLNGNANSASCKYCKKTGHTVDKCYRLFGFPADFKFTKNKKSASCVQTEVPYVPSSFPSAASSDNSAHGFTKKQYEHLLSMFQQVQLSNGMSPDDSSIEDSGFAHFAYLFTAYDVDYLVSHACAFSHLDADLFPSFLAAPIVQPSSVSCNKPSSFTPCFNQPSIVVGSACNQINVDSTYGYTRVTWTHLLSCKGNALSILKAFTSMVKIHFHSNVHTFRSDNAFELGGSTEAINFFGNEGILHQTTIPHTPQQNGLVERKYKHLLEVARALLFQSKLPLKFWEECILTATYLINRMSSPLLLKLSPYEKLHGTPPTYEHLKSFGCLCFATSSKVGRNKFQSRAISSLFLGYPYGKKGYKLLNLSNFSIFYSRDVVFHEHVFPYKSVFYSPPSFFPSSVQPFAESSSADSATLSATEGVSPSTSSHHMPHLAPSPLLLSPVISNTPSPNSTGSIYSSEISLPSHVSPPLRKSLRTVTKPTYLNDYVCNSASLPISSPDSSMVAPSDLHMHESQFYL